MKNGEIKDFLLLIDELRGKTEPIYLDTGIYSHYHYEGNGEGKDIVLIKPDKTRGVISTSKVLKAFREIVSRDDFQGTPK